MPVYDVFHKPQAQPGAALLPHTGVRSPKKAFEQAGSVFGLDPNSTVMNRDQDASFPSAGIGRHIDRDIALVV